MPFNPHPDMPVYGRTWYDDGLTIVSQSDNANDHRQMCTWCIEEKIDDCVHLSASEEGDTTMNSRR